MKVNMCIHIHDTLALIIIEMYIDVTILSVQILTAASAADNAGKLGFSTSTGASSDIIIEPSSSSMAAIFL